MKEIISGSKLESRISEETTDSQKKKTKRCSVSGTDLQVRSMDPVDVDVALARCVQNYGNNI